MKPLKAKTLRAKSSAELVKLSQERRAELFKGRFDHYTGQLRDHASIRIIRRDIARIETVLRERELSQEAEG